MTKKEKKTSRKQQILQTLAAMLETNAGERITTAKLAAEVGVSEAALYRHFPSKARMFEGLIEFIEETLFSRINLIMKEETICHIRCHKILTLILTFSARNPGISCLMTGDGLTGEQSRLRERINQLFDRLQTQLKQVIRESALTGSEQTKDALVVANLYLSIVEGRIRQFVRSGFKQSPLASWNSQWEMINQG
ncbi:MAG: nucleoid occlusion factor SlmA [Gammaproteobacteria bacterium CG22_combo_CG10-13_8_21_14_all_40_8]|nr:MAG: nucleoid occlusion factor SlmA [Gammaproteobacteria bacterium CG22_combo_CG10-13_8_21_14_all_40_8]